MAQTSECTIPLPQNRDHLNNLLATLVILLYILERVAHVRIQVNTPPTNSLLSTYAAHGLLTEPLYICSFHITLMYPIPPEQPYQ